MSLTQAFAVLIFIHILFIGLSLYDWLGILILFLAVQSDRVTGHLFPKRIDLFSEVSELDERLKYVQLKFDEMESDITALKFGNARMK